MSRRQVPTELYKTLKRGSGPGHIAGGGGLSKIPDKFMDGPSANPVNK